MVLAAGALLPRTRVIDAVQDLDERLLTAVVARRRPGWRRPARLLTALAEPAPVVLLWSTAALWAWCRGVPAAVVLRAGTRAAAGIAARRALAEAVHRERPQRSWWWATPTGFSYPSRHVTWALLGFGAAADVLASAGADRRRIRTVVAGAITGVGATRLVLALHWPSDVAAAIAMGDAWRTLTSGRRATPGTR